MADEDEDPRRLTERGFALRETLFRIGAILPLLVASISTELSLRNVAVLLSASSIEARTSAAKALLCSLTSSSSSTF
jgi:hypothetical protein